MKRRRFLPIILLAILVLMIITTSGKIESIISALKWAFLGIIVISVIGVIIYYVNKIIVLSNRVDYAWANIDVQLTRRYDLIPNLVEIVKGYATHEKEVFEKVTEARAQAISAEKSGDPKKIAGAENFLAGTLKTLFAVAENYPQLKANENFKLLQAQLEETESEIASARQLYNNSVLAFNNTIGTIPGVWFAALIGKIKRSYFEIKEEERVVPKVSSNE